jgi:copper chaperone NosL
MFGMKKWLSLFLVAMLMLAVGCSQKEEANKATKTEMTNKEASDEKEKQNEDILAKAAMAEPDENTVCAFCNMKVYPKDHELGKFTAKLVKENGEVLFFDDVGCLLNYERDQSQKAIKKYVRDYNSFDWIEAEKATIVKADIKTPMNYGYAFFAKKEDAETFVNGHSNLNASIVSWEDVDSVAHERYMKKKMMQNNNHEHSDNHDHNQNNNSH